MSENHKAIKLAELLGLDPSQIINIDATWEPVGPVEINFNGKIFMSKERWSELMEEVRAL